MQKLSQTSFTQNQIRAATGVSERTQLRLKNQPKVTDADDPNFHKLRGVGRPSTSDLYAEIVRPWSSELRRPEDGPIKVEVLAQPIHS